MEVLIDNKPRSLETTRKFGREGEIYRLPNDAKRRLAKIYDRERRTALLERKIVAIINKMRHLDLGGVENFIAYPEVAVYDGHGFCGFLMKNFDNHTDLFDSRFDLRNSSYPRKNMDDKKAICITATLFGYLRLLHSAGFILGDINPDNILLHNSTDMPVLVDFDSVQVGTYFCSTYRLDYADPAVRVDGYGRSKYFIYTVDSDIFAMTIVCYELIVGIHPYFFQTVDATDTRYHKENDLSFMDIVEGNKAKLDHFATTVIENAAYEMAKQRLAYIKIAQPEIYAHFKAVFSAGHREYFAMRSGLQIAKEASAAPSESEDVFGSLLPQSKEDPEELELFMEQFRFTL